MVEVEQFANANHEFNVCLLSLIYMVELRNRWAMGNNEGLDNDFDVASTQNLCIIVFPCFSKTPKRMFMIVNASVCYFIVYLCWFSGFVMHEVLIIIAKKLT